MNSNEHSLVEQTKHAAGRFGGFSFGGRHPEGVTPHNPLTPGTVFPNGASAALLLTFDVEGNYGNGADNVPAELANYRRICRMLAKNRIPATFNVVGKMADDHGPQFIEWMLDANCEIASHGYWHDLNKHYGGDKVYAGHYGPKENLEQIKKGVEALNSICPRAVRGVRIPYGHFNEFTYDAIEQLGLTWASNVGIDDFLTPSQGFGGAPFQMQIGNKLYNIVEIPLDSQTYDWAVWITEEKTNETFVQAVAAYCRENNIPVDRTPQGAVRVWKQRMADAVKKQSVFTLLCHPINLTVKSDKWSDPVEEFLFPVIEQLADLQRSRLAWVCTCSQLADFYRQVSSKR
ncbi:MAG: polysaccharide deacetylase family protein [Planctomycetota bacterium]